MVSDCGFNLPSMTSDCGFNLLSMTSGCGFNLLSMTSDCGFNYYLSCVNNNNIIIIAFKGAIRDFFTISSLRRELSPTRKLKWPGSNRVEIMYNISSTYHVQHVMLAATW